MAPSENSKLQYLRKFSGGLEMTSIKKNLKLDTGCAVSQISSQDRLVSVSLTRAWQSAKHRSYPTHPTSFQQWIYPYTSSNQGPNL